MSNELCATVIFEDPFISVLFLDCDEEIDELILLEDEIMTVIFPQQIIIKETPKDYIESLTLEVTKSNTFETVLSLVTGIISEGRYRIDWSFLWNTEATARSIEVRVLIDGFEKWEIIGVTETSNENLSASCFIVVDFLNEDHTIDIQYRQSPGGGPNKNVSIQDRRIAIQRWDSAS